MQETLAPSADFVKLREGVRNYASVRQLSGSSVAESRDDNLHTAMAAKHLNSHGNRPNVSTQRPKGNCFVCGVPGHYKAQCYKKDTASCSICKRKGHLAKACRKQKGEANGAAMTAVKMGKNCEAMISSFAGSVQTVRDSNHLIVDTGCTEHMITERGYFSEFEERPGNVKNPDGSVTKKF